MNPPKDQDQGSKGSTPDQTVENVNSDETTYPKELSNSSENVYFKNFKDSAFNENFNANSCSQDDGGSITEDDFYSLHSDNNILNNVSTDTPFDMYDNQSVSASDYASNDYVSTSQNSCYRSISSSLGESLSFYKDSKSFHSYKTHSLETDERCSTEVSEVMPKIQDVEFEISSNFSASLSHIIDPSDFWIQIENSHGSELRFSK